ncbi:MAG TPA: molecular chaperone DnaK, partial [Micavibrio sp.]
EKANALSEASMKLGEIAYRKAQENAAGEPDNAAHQGQPSSTSAGKDDVVDADFMELEDEDDKKSAG